MNWALAARLKRSVSSYKLVCNNVVKLGLFFFHPLAIAPVAPAFRLDALRIEQVCLYTASFGFHIFYILEEVSAAVERLHVQLVIFLAVDVHVTKLAIVHEATRLSVWGV